MAGERSADEIQRDIENARESLAVAVDQLAYRTNPKRIADNAKQTLKDKAQTPQGKAVIARRRSAARDPGHPQDRQALSGGADTPADKSGGARTQSAMWILSALTAMQTRGAPCPST